MLRHKRKDWVGNRSRTTDEGKLGLHAERFDPKTGKEGLFQPQSQRCERSIPRGAQRLMPVIFPPSQTFLMKMAAFDQTRHIAVTRTEQIGHAEECP